MLVPIELGAFDLSQLRKQIKVVKGISDLEIAAIVNDILIAVAFMHKNKIA